MTPDWNFENLDRHTIFTILRSGDHEISVWVRCWFGLGILFAPAEGKRTREKVVGIASRLAQPDDLSDPAPTGSSTGDRNSHSIPTSEEREAPSLDDAVVQTLNTAKKNELMSVRGIGNATAKRIIKNGPYSICL